LSLAQFLGSQFAGTSGGEGMGGAVEMPAHGFERQHVAAARTEGTFAAASTGQLLEALAQRIQPFAGFRGSP